MSITKTVSISLTLLLVVAYLYADDSVQEILRDYNPDTLTQAQAVEISEKLKTAGIRPGPEQDELIRAEGFDPEIIRTLSPPPPRPSEPTGPHPPDNRPSDGSPNNHTIRKVFQSLETDYGISDFTISSVAIENGELLEEYKCEEKFDGTEKSIPLSWDNVPEGTESLAIVMYHYPNPNDKTRVNSYLLLWGIAPSVKEIAHGEVSYGDWYMGQNKDGNAISYTSPCSPSPGTHQYTVSIFALSSYPGSLPEESTMEVDFTVFMDAIESTEIIGKADLSFGDVHE